MSGTHDGRVPEGTGLSQAEPEVSALTGFDPSRTERAWPLGGYAPGNYFCKCVSCGEQFEGDKRALVCLECAAGDIKFWLADQRAKVRAWEDWLVQCRASLDALIHAASVFWGAGSEQHNLVRDVADAVLKNTPRDSDGSGAAGETEGLDPKDDSAGLQGIAQPSNARDPS